MFKSEFFHDKLYLVNQSIYNMNNRLLIPSLQDLFPLEELEDKINVKSRSR